MAVDVLLIDEEQNVLEHIKYPWAVPERLIPFFDETSFPMLRYIDPYGDTFFNRPQMHDFISEWQRLHSRAETEQERDFLDSVERLAERCKSEPGLFLKFVGD